MPFFKFVLHFVVESSTMVSFTKQARGPHLFQDALIVKVLWVSMQEVTLCCLKWYVLNSKSY